LQSIRVLNRAVRRAVERRKESKRVHRRRQPIIRRGVERRKEGKRVHNIRIDQYIPQHSRVRHFDLNFIA
jgi:hypothetical protein